MTITATDNAISEILYISNTPSYFYNRIINHPEVDKILNRLDKKEIIKIYCKTHNAQLEPNIENLSILYLLLTALIKSCATIQDFASLNISTNKLPWGDFFIQHYFDNLQPMTTTKATHLSQKSIPYEHNITTSTMNFDGGKRLIGYSQPIDNSTSTSLDVK